MLLIQNLLDAAIMTRQSIFGNTVEVSVSASEPLTIEEFRDVLPPSMKKNISPELMDTINTAITDPEQLAVFRENVIGFTSVMKEGRFKLTDYLSAVKFVSHRLLGDNQITAWAKTFPTRYADMIQKGIDRSEIGAITSRYSGSKLIISIMGQTIMPTHIVNAPLYQKAINVQADLMMNAKSEKVRSDAAANLLMTLRPPEVQKMQLEIGVKEDSTIQELRETTMELARQQRQMIEAGTISVKSIAHSKLIGNRNDITDVSHV
jgi:hypothetical protein